MSTTFEIYPTNKIIPRIPGIIADTMRMFNAFLQRHSTTFHYSVSVVQFENGEPIDSETEDDGFLTCREDRYTAFSINGEGWIYVFIHELDSLDDAVWEDELASNLNAQAMRQKIQKNRDIGWYWVVKRTAGQPAIASLIYGYLAIAIARAADGFIYSSDGAWNYSSFPMGADDFEREYLSPEEIAESDQKEWFLELIDIIKDRGNLCTE